MPEERDHDRGLAGGRRRSSSPSRRSSSATIPTRSSLLPSREQLAQSGVDAKYKRSGPNDLYIVPLANALTNARDTDKRIRQAKGQDASGLRGDHRRRHDHAVPPARRGALHRRAERVRQVPPDGAQREEAVAAPRSRHEARTPASCPIETRRAARSAIAARESRAGAGRSSLSRRRQLLEVGLGELLRAARVLGEHARHELALLALEELDLLLDRALRRRGGRPSRPWSGRCGARGRSPAPRRPGSTTDRSG